MAWTPQEYQPRKQTWRTDSKQKIIMVERVKKITEVMFKNATEIKRENEGERVTIVLASYQEGQVRHTIM